MSAHEVPITVVLATDNLLIGDGLAALLTGRPEVEVLGRVNSIEEMLAVVAELHPEVLIITIRTSAAPTMAAIATARQLRAEHPELGIVVISDRANGFALELLRGGASRLAYLLDQHLTDLGTLIGALREVRAGQTVLDPSIVDSLVERRDGLVIDDLTPRELDVLEQVAHGFSNAAIAANLYVSVKAVEKNITTIFRKLGLADQRLIDRRVTAGLIYLRAQTSPLSLHRPTVVDEV